MVIFDWCTESDNGRGAWRRPGCLAGCAGFRTGVMSCSGDATVRGSGRGAADVQVGGGGAGGDAAGCVWERLPGFDLVVAVAVPVGGDPGGGDHGQGVLVGGVPGGFGQRGGGGAGPDGGDQGAAGGGERQVPGGDRLSGAPSLAEGCAMAAAERVAARTSWCRRHQAARSWRISSGLAERRIAPVPGPASWMADMASRSAVSEPSHRHR